MRRARTISASSKEAFDCRCDVIEIVERGLHEPVKLWRGFVSRSARPHGELVVSVDNWREIYRLFHEHAPLNVGDR